MSGISSDDPGAGLGAGKSRPLVREVEPDVGRVGGDGAAGFEGRWGGIMSPLHHEVGKVLRTKLSASACASLVNGKRPGL